MNYLKINRWRLPVFQTFLAFGACYTLGHLTQPTISQWLSANHIDRSINYRQAVTSMPPLKAPWFLAYDKGSLEAQVLYFNIKDIHHHIQNADFIAVGNSRTQHGIDHQTIDSFLHSKGLRYFNLAIGHKSNFILPKQILHKAQAKPKWLLVNTDSFFEPTPNQYTTDILGNTPLQANQYYFEKATSFKVRQTLYRYFPLLSYTAHSQWVTFASLENGGWLSRVQTPARAPIQVGNGPAPQSLDDLLKTALAFKHEMAKQGTKLILTTIPYQNSHPSIEEGKAIAQFIDAPFIAPHTENLSTNDSSHLSQESAHLFTSKLIEQLENVIE